jgi:hypothetical protein
MTALIFKAPHPHISLGPMAANPNRLPYQPSIDVPTLDNGIYIQSRLAVVNYAKKAIIDKSAVSARTITPKLLQPPDGLESNNPEALPTMLTAFGTLQNQCETLAEQAALRHAREVAHAPSRVLSTAAGIAAQYRWKEGEEHKQPRLDRIQKVLDNNGPGSENCQIRKNYDATRKFNKGLLSQDWFPGRTKLSKPEWVDEIGSSFKNITIEQEEVVVLKRKQSGPSATCRRYAAEYKKNGPKPWKCLLCEGRYTTPRGHKVHVELRHKDQEYVPVGPTLDPHHTTVAIEE